MWASRRGLAPVGGSSSGGNPPAAAIRLREQRGSNPVRHHPSRSALAHCRDDAGASAGGTASALESPAADRPGARIQIDLEIRRRFCSALRESQQPKRPGRAR